MSDSSGRITAIAFARQTGRALAAGVARGSLLLALFTLVTWLMFFQLGAAKGRPALGDLDEALLVASPDGPLVVWILSWSAHALRHHPTRLFDANMFHPVENSLAYTESMAPVAPLWSVLRTATGDPVLALNLFLLLTTVLNLCGGYLLAKWLTGRVDAAILGAALFAFNGYASAQRVHLQLQLMFLVPVALLLLFAWLERRRWSHAVLFAVTWAVLSVMVVYYGVIFSLMVAVVLLGYLIAKRLRPGRRFATGLVMIGLLAGVLVAPLAWSYHQARESLPRAPRSGHRLEPIDLLTPSVGSLLYRPLEAWGPPRSEEHRHFPGFLGIALGTVGLWHVARGGRRHGRTDIAGVPGSGDRRLYAGLLALAGALCLLLAFGEQVRGVPLPYGWLRQHLPGFDGLRVASRIAFGTLVAGTMLAAVGYARLTASLADRRGRRRFAGSIVAVAAISFALLENASRTRLFPIPIQPEEAAINRALAAASSGAVLELPIATNVGPQPARMEAKRFMLSVLDWKPRVNGYSGAYPRGYFERAADLDRFPQPRALRWLCELDVRYVVLRVADPESKPRLTPHTAKQILARMPRHARWEQHSDDFLIDLGDWLDWRAGRCPVPAPLTP